MIEAIEEVTGTSQTESTPTVPHTAAATNSDGVALSETAQALLLQQEGLSVGEIADELGIATTTVLSDLDIASAITQTPATTVGGGGATASQASSQI